jgi:RNase P subunit RPR2
MKNKFTMIQEHFRKLRCSHCQAAFTPDGVKLLREEKDYMVVRVHCTSCQEPSGVAVVGLDFDGTQVTAPKAEKAERPVRSIFSSRKEEERFAQMKPISADEVLDAAEFIRNLGEDWMRHLGR